jgi:hypothetical protein
MKMRNQKRVLSLAVTWLLVAALAVLRTVGSPAAHASVDAEAFKETIDTLASLGERRTGTEGFLKAADYVRLRLQSIGFEDVATHRYRLPLRRHGKSHLELPGRAAPILIQPFFGNAISPGTIAPQGLGSCTSSTARP